MAEAMVMYAWLNVARQVYGEVLMPLPVTNKNLYLMKLFHSLCVLSSKVAKKGVGSNAGLGNLDSSCLSFRCC